MRVEIKNLREKREEGNRRFHSERGRRNIAERKAQWIQGTGSLGKEEYEGPIQTKYVFFHLLLSQLSSVNTKL